VFHYPKTAARRDKPQSIRALYGADGTINAVHGSDSIESAQREISFWFPKASLRTGKSATAQLSSHQFPEMSAYMNQVVDPVVAPIILRVSEIFFRGDRPLLWPKRLECGLTTCVLWLGAVLLWGNSRWCSARPTL
jgi:hypothetical protein